MTGALQSGGTCYCRRDFFGRPRGRRLRLRAPNSSSVITHRPETRVPSLPFLHRNLTRRSDTPSLCAASFVSRSLIERRFYQGNNDPSTVPFLLDTVPYTVYTVHGTYMDCLYG